MKLAGKNALVLGLGETGLSMARFLERRGARVRVADTRDDPPRLAALGKHLPQAELALGAYHDESFSGVDLVAISPGVPLATPQVRAAAARGVPVVGDIELFAQALREGDSRAQSPPPSSPPQVLAVTGTNGKTTVTALTGAMCRRGGLATEVAGNIGPAALDALMQCEDVRHKPEVWVLELSSFQLETTRTLNPVAAAVLNLSEDHLDRYDGMDAYARAKARIFWGEGIQVLNRDDARSMNMAVAGRKQMSFGLAAPRRAGDFGLLRVAGELWLAQGATPLLALKELPLAGLHNAANALAALALTRALGLSYTPLLAALRDFKGLPHRLEKVAEFDGVAFYDDSKGTNVGATVAALNGFAELAARGARVVLIAGGEGKGQNFAPLAEPVSRYARSVVLIGRDAERIARALGASGIALLRAGSMEEAVAEARAQAQPGDVVLLSPACASFDMFRNYPHRGEVFAGCVRKMAHAQLH
ncbi:MAG: UDP-N-acetylmuramoylalanine--D-glutamate ligase [Betaproteobacteria bacterium RIFCSPLOWO2_02_FULL_65_24]|nr:MAG: UDP-N-acetylmuramoylalanine--D-glutamate ligase [Betaproteobacteria bacterium RIFCSPLOWO2_02_FULL_65_24]